MVFFFSVVNARRRFGSNEPESLLICAAGPAALNIVWRPIKNGLMTTSKMNWQIRAVIGYSRCRMLDTGFWVLVDTGYRLLVKGAVSRFGKKTTFLCAPTGPQALWLPAHRAYSSERPEVVSAVNIFLKVNSQFRLFRVPYS